MAGRKYHWKHGWIPLDAEARRQKYGDDHETPAHAHVAHKDLPRASHVVATHSPKHNSFDLHDTQTGARLSLSTDHADQLQSSRKQIEGIDSRSNLRTGPIGGGQLPPPPKGLSKADRGHYDRELALARKWSDNDLESALRGAQQNEYESKQDRFASAYGMKPSTARAIRLAYEAEKKRRNSTPLKGLPSRDSGNLTGMGFGL